MGRRVVRGTGGVRALEGEDLGWSDWFPIDQDRVNRFAEATDDAQWIHVDPERAARESPFGGPVAHGFLTLSLVSHLFFETLEVQDVRLVVNYGLGRVRFPAPVPVGRRIRMGFVVKQVEEVAGGVQCVFEVTAEIEGGAKPALVAEVLFRYYD